MSITPMAHEPRCCGVSTNLEDYFLTRRRFLNRVGIGLGALGLATMLDPAHLLADGPGGSVELGADPLSPRKPPLPGAVAFKSRAPLGAWTKLAHGLFQTDEAMFLN